MNSKNMTKGKGDFMAKIIVALDDMGREKALLLADKLRDGNVLFKGNDLLDEAGLDVIVSFKSRGGFMADPKIHDIPNTARTRVRHYAARCPEFITVHASGGVEMMRAAVEGTDGKSNILAVTVLTSLGEEECTLNLGGPVKAKVLQYARNALLAGVYGIVCSPQELKFLSGFRELKTLKKVTPGIRPKWHIDPKDDQSRITTPYDAVMMGADYIVIGRPIVQAADPYEAVQKTQQEVEEALLELITGRKKSKKEKR